jgi:hypothetical protein
VEFVEGKVAMRQIYLSILTYNHHHIKGWHMKCISGLNHQPAQSQNPSIFIILLHANIWEFSIIQAPLSFLFHNMHCSMPLNVKE